MWALAARAAGQQVRERTSGENEDGKGEVEEDKTSGGVDERSERKSGRGVTGQDGNR